MITKKEIFSVLNKGDKNSFLGNGVQGILSSALLGGIDYFSKKMTIKEAKEYVKEVSKGEAQYREAKSKNAAFIRVTDSGKHIIYTGENTRNRVTLAHELGHFIAEKRVRSYNRSKLENNLDNIGHTPKQIIGAELEAWQEAEKIVPKTLDFKLQKRLALNTYKHSMALHLKSTADDEAAAVYTKRFFIRTLLPIFTGVISNQITKNTKSISLKQKARITLISVALGSLLAHYFIKRFT